MSIATGLLRWYDGHRRDLPWRRAPSPYRTVVSEFMLQQTVVATVVPYFQRFIKRFPDMRALAAAPQSGVLALWSGLGYYSRARRLHELARVVVSEHGGSLPRDEAALRRLPGVGPYTAAAVAAIAFGARTFALDGNAARVVARLFAVPDLIDTPPSRDKLRALGQSLVPARRAGDFAQAVMELGARVCVAREPRCPECPVAGMCRALATGKTSVLPVRGARKAKRVVRVVCALAGRRGRVLLVRRPMGTLLGGTWVLPSVEPRAGEDHTAASRRALAEVGLTTQGAGRLAGSFQHIFTHRDVTADVVHLAARGRVAGTIEGRWVAPRDWPKLALSSFARKSLQSWSAGGHES